MNTDNYQVGRIEFTPVDKTDYKAKYYAQLKRSAVYRKRILDLMARVTILQDLLACHDEP